jgi:hypothetical protein
MATREILDLGASANNGSGDTLRSGGDKINRNFGKLFNFLGPDSDTLSERLSFDSDGIIYTGTSFTTRLGFFDPSSNQTITFPNSSGVVVTTTATQTLQNKILRNPIIADPSDNEYLVFTSNASAVNHIRITNAAASGKPIIEAIGTDTNIHLDLLAKGTGSTHVNKLAVHSETVDSDGAVSLEFGYTIFNSAIPLSITLTNGIVAGERKAFTNRGAGAVTITPASFGPGTSFTMPQNSGCELIWDSTAWYILSAFPDSDITVT